MRLSSEDLDRLAAQQTIDWTTRGRKSGEPRRIEIWWLRFEGRFIITGAPGRRGWLANVRADPRVVIHASGKDMEATITFIDDPAFRRRLFEHPDANCYLSYGSVEELVESAPMIEIRLPTDG